MKQYACHVRAGVSALSTLRTAPDYWRADAQILADLLGQPVTVTPPDGEPEEFRPGGGIEVGELWPPK